MVLPRTQVDEGMNGVFYRSPLVRSVFLLQKLLRNSETLQVIIPQSVCSDEDEDVIWGYVVIGFWAKDIFQEEEARDGAFSLIFSCVVCVCSDVPLC